MRLVFQSHPGDFLTKENVLMQPSHLVLGLASPARQL